MVIFVCRHESKCVLKMQNVHVLILNILGSVSYSQFLFLLFFLLSTASFCCILWFWFLFARDFESQHKTFGMPTAILCYRKHDKTCYYTKYPKYTAAACTHGAHITRENSKGHWYTEHRILKSWARTQHITLATDNYGEHYYHTRHSQNSKIKSTHSALTHHCSFMALQYIAPSNAFWSVRSLPSAHKRFRHIMSHLSIAQFMLE